MREYGHQLLDGRKERRRFSLLSMRKFTGDYLDVKNGSGLATMIRNALTLKGNAPYNTGKKTRKGEGLIRACLFCCQVGRKSCLV